MFSSPFWLKSVDHAAVLPLFLLSHFLCVTLVSLFFPPRFLLYFSLPPLTPSILSLKPVHLPIGPLADLSSGLYDDSDSEVEEVEAPQKGVGGSVTSPQGNLPHLPFFKKVTLVITQNASIDRLLQMWLIIRDSLLGMGTETRYLIGLGAKLWKTGVSISSDVNGSVIGTGEIMKTHIHLLLLYIYIYTLSCQFYPARVTSCFYMQ